MNDILQDIETAELHTYNTIKIITSLQETIAKLSQDNDASDIELSQFEAETEYLKKLAQKVADDLTPPVPNPSSISLARKFTKIKTKSSVIDSSPKFIKAKPKNFKEMTEKSQQTCDKKTSKSQSKNESGIIHSKKHKFKKHIEPIQLEPKAFSTLVLHNEPPLQPTKYLQHILIPIGKVNFKNLSTQSMPSNWQHNGSKLIFKSKYNELPFQKTPFKQVMKRASGVEHFTKLMQLCMNVKEERESDLEKQIYNLEEEMQVVMESNKNLYNALEKLEEQNASKKVLRDSSTNTLTEITQSSKADIIPDLPLDTQFPTNEQITNDLAEDIIKCIHADIQEITTNIAKTKSQSKLIFAEHDKIGNPKYEYGKHVSFLEKAIASMQNKLETAQNKQVELAIQSKAVVEAAHRMTNEPWTY